jgi:hypothetical protein
MHHDKDAWNSGGIPPFFLNIGWLAGLDAMAKRAVSVPHRKSDCGSSGLPIAHPQSLYWLKNLRFRYLLSVARAPG